MFPYAAAVFSPSSSTVPFPVRRARALGELERLFTTVHVGPGWDRSVNGQAGSPLQRSEELVELAALPDNPLLIASTGGYSCNEILPHLNYGLLNELRPTICGFSDVSTLLLALHANTGVRCLHGPTVLASYGQFGGVDEYTHGRLLDSITDGQPILLHPPEWLVIEPSRWDDGDDAPSRKTPSGGWMPVHGGIAEGPAIVANLEVFEGLLATPYLPPLHGAVLILEAADGPVERIVRQLEHLDQTGELKRVSALVFGRLPWNIDPDQRLHEVLAALGRRHGMPVLADFDVGHTDPKITIPLGGLVRVDAGAATLALNPMVV